MVTNVPEQVDVAIVGAGPAGLATACALRQNSINAVVLDAAPEASPFSRATILHSHTLEALDTLGVTGELLREGVRISAFNAWSRKARLTQLKFSKMHAKYPFTLGIPQSVTEDALMVKLAALGGKVIWGAKVSALVDDGKDVLLEVKGGAGSTAYIRADYVVGADGLHSTVRKALYIPYEGGDYTASMLAADVRLSTTGTFLFQPHEASLCFGKDNFALFMAFEPGLWRVLLPQDNAPKHPTKQQIQARIDERAPSGVHVEELLWSNRFRIHHRQASQYRKGRVFLVGDAAHTFTPAGGQGMNAGIQDGIKLAEILRAAIEDYEDSDADLDRYEQVRRPVANDIIKMTHRLTVVGQWKSAWARWARDWFIELFMQLSGVEENMTRKVAAFDRRSPSSRPQSSTSQPSTSQPSILQSSKSQSSVEEMWNYASRADLH